MIERIFDITTQETTEKEFTKKQKDQYVKDQEQSLLLQAEYKVKQDARESAIKKLAEIAGLTKDELASIL